MARDPTEASAPSVPAPVALYLLRHGTAVTRGRGRFAEDFNRPLSGEGAKDLLRIGRGLKNGGVRLDWIVASPLLRAWQTAEILRAIFGSRLPLSSCDHLSPGGSLEGLLDFLARHPSRRRILVVGHEPALSRWAKQLLGASPAANLHLKKGGCCRIALDELSPKPAGRLDWWLGPRILRRLA